MAEAAHPAAVETHAGTEAHGGTAHAAPNVGGFITAPVVVAIAMVIVLAILLWKRVPGAIGRSLDAKIDAIRDQLAEAETLRKEAEALKAEYEAKANAAGTDAAAMIERARHEAELIVDKANKDAEALVERRGRMAEEKIAAEERAAIAALRSTAASAATRAAAKLIAERNDPAADSKIIDQAIAGITKGA